MEQVVDVCRDEEYETVGIPRAFNVSRPMAQACETPCLEQTPFLA